MSDYFASLAASALGLTPKLAPRVRGLFEPEKLSDLAMPASDDVWGRVPAAAEFNGADHLCETDNNEDQRAASMLPADPDGPGKASQPKAVDGHVARPGATAPRTLAPTLEPSVQSVTDRRAATLAHERLEPVAHDGLEQVARSGDRPSAEAASGRALAALSATGEAVETGRSNDTVNPLSEAPNGVVPHRMRVSNAPADFDLAGLADVESYGPPALTDPAGLTSSPVAQAFGDAGRAGDHAVVAMSTSGGDQRSAAADHATARDRPASVGSVKIPGSAITPASQYNAERPPTNRRSTIRHSTRTDDVAAATPDIQITIGRIEVRLPAIGASPRPAPPRYAPQVGIAEFKASRNRK